MRPFVAPLPEDPAGTPEELHEKQKIRKTTRVRNPLGPQKLWLLARFRNPYVVVSRLGNIKLPHMKLPAYERASDQHKIRNMLECLLRDPSLITMSVTINVHKKLSSQLRSADKMDYIRDESRKAIKPFYGETPIYFALVPEVSKTGRIHFHGFLAISKDRYYEGLPKDLSDALQSSSLSRKYKKVANNVAVNVTEKFLLGDAESGFIESKITSGWADYILKSYLPSESVNFVASPELKTKAKNFYQQIRLPS